MASKKRVDLSINDKLKVLEALQTPGSVTFIIVAPGVSRASSTSPSSSAPELNELFFFHILKKSGKPGLSGKEIFSQSFPIRRVRL